MLKDVCSQLAGNIINFSQATQSSRFSYLLLFSARFSPIQNGNIHRRLDI